jgi:hypothetical protein
VAEDRHEGPDGYGVSLVSVRRSHDLAPMLKAPPGGDCPCPHCGNVLKGRIIVRYQEREEVLEAGDAFYMMPGHAPEAEEGTELVQFSPAEQLAAVVEALKRAMP